MRTQNSLDEEYYILDGIEIRNWKDLKAAVNKAQERIHVCDYDIRGNEIRSLIQKRLEKEGLKFDNSYDIKDAALDEFLYVSYEVKKKIDGKDLLRKSKFRVEDLDGHPFGRKEITIVPDTERGEIDADVLFHRLLRAYHTDSFYRKMFNLIYGRRKLKGEKNWYLDLLK